MAFVREKNRMKFARWILLALLVSTGLPALAQEAAENAWEAWSAVVATDIGDDNSGAIITPAEMSDDAVSRALWQVMPGGSAEETKIAIPFAGSDLETAMQGSQLIIEVYLPPANRLHPTDVFLGLADVTDGFDWMGGVFTQSVIEPGWNRVVFTPDAAMRATLPERRYTLFLSFFHTDANGSRVPLTEPLFLGNARIGAADETQVSLAAEYQDEVEMLLTLDDAAFIDAVARAAFDYFWNEANPENGLIRDRSRTESPSSIAAVGFGLAAIPIGVERGWIDADGGYARALVTLQAFASGGVQGENGFYYHFVTMDTGRRAWQSELSSIDTALLLAGALTVGEYFAGTEVQQLANELYARADWEWMRAGREFVAMGWTPESGFLNASWDHFDESLLLYVLAIGSPTHAIPADVWDAWQRPVNLRGEYVYLPGEPLFVYQYPLAFLGLRGMEDAYVHYWNNAARACERNRAFSERSADRYRTYQDGVWGISASDGPNGYRAYGAAPGNHDGTIAPYASAACLPLTPQSALDGMRALLRTYGARAWRTYGFVSALNAEVGWYSTEHIGIDQGDILLMLANAQDGLVWDLFTRHPRVQFALEAMQFVESSDAAYAVTPAFLARLRGE
jgi:hypothetical protein